MKHVRSYLAKRGGDYTHWFVTEWTAYLGYTLLAVLHPPDIKILTVQLLNMSIRRFTALGTASQVPNTRRNQHASFLKWDKEGFLFDPGEGTQRQMIFCGISATEITKIFITHFHGDHCLGLSSILQRLSLDKVQHPIQIYYPASGQNFFENIRGVSSYYDVAFIEPHPIEQEGVVFSDENFIVKHEG